MNPYFRFLISFVFLTVFVQNTFAAKHYVTSILDSSTPISGEFVYEVNNAASGDTVIVNISGNLMLQNQIIPPNGGVTIVGPYPIHFKIDGSSYSGGNVFNIPSGSTVSISNIGFVNFTDSPIFNYTYFSSNDNLKVKGCLFYNLKSSGSGNSRVLFSLENTLSARFDACSFISDSSTTDGGVFLIGDATYSGGNVIATNCTFHHNYSSSHGGAIYLRNGFLQLTNNTFHTNSTNGLGSSLNTYSGTCILENNIFYNPILSSNQFANTSATCIDNGGNITDDLTANIWQTFTGSNPMPTTQSNLDPLLKPLVTDGYGMMYFPIANDISPCIDVGSNPAVTEYDARKLWRQMGWGGVISPVDAGAVEYTPYVVDGVNDWSNMYSNYTDETARTAIVFEGVGVKDVSLGGQNTIGTRTIITGFTQEGSRVPGPGPTLGSVTPAKTLVRLSPGTNLTGGVLSITTDSCVITGFSFIQDVGTPGASGIEISGTSGTIITGCHIGLKENGLYEDGLSNGIVLTNYASGNMIGNNTYVDGVKANCRNVISGNSNNQITIQDGQNNLISNNFIGPDANGNNMPIGFPLLSGTGVLLENVQTPVSNHHNIIGGLSFEDRNVISGLYDAIYINNLENNEVVNNFIGTDLNGLDGGTFTDLAVKNGVTLYGYNAIDNLVGLPNAGNVIGNFTDYGIQCLSSSQSTLRGNKIGLGLDALTDISCTGSVNQLYGIYVGSYSSYNMFGGPNLADRNYIGNNEIGIVFEFAGADNDTIYGNYIGVNLDGNAAPNTTGIAFWGGASGITVGDTLPGYGNTIAYNTANGIEGDAFGNMFHVSGNSIHNNGSTSSLGIDLDSNGPSITYGSSPGDCNGILPPVLLSAYDCGVGKTTLFYQPNNDYNSDTLVFELFIADSDKQEGEQFISSFQLKSWSSYDDTLAITLPVLLNVGDVIVATATNKHLNYYSYTYQFETSEFSDSLAVTVQPTGPSLTISQSTICDGAAPAVITATGAVGTPIYYSDAGLINRLGSGSTFSVNNVTGPGVYTYYVADSVGFCLNPGGNVTLTVVAPTPATITGPTSACNGDAVSYSGPAGMSNYLWQINTVIGSSISPTTTVNTTASFGSPSMNYSKDTLVLTVTDANLCTASDTLIVNVGITPLITVTPNTDSICDGNTSTFTVTTVTLNTYLWSNGSTSATQTVNPTSTTTYTLTATDADGIGCTAIDSAVIVVNPLPDFTFTTTDISCYGANDGAINITVTTGTPMYYYIIDGTVADSSTTANYTIDSMFATPGLPIHVTDANGCSSPDTNFVINEPSQLVAGAVSSSDVLCNGDATGTASTLTPSGGTSGYFFQWMNSSNAPVTGANTQSYSGFIAGSYFCIVSDANGCQDTTTAVTIAEPPVLLPSIDSVHNTTCYGGADGIIYGNVSGGSGTTTFVWYDSPGGNQVAGQTTSTANSLSPGDYYFIVTDGNNCTAQSGVETVGQPAQLIATANGYNMLCGNDTTGSIDIDQTGGAIAPFNVSLNNGLTYTSASSLPYNWINLDTGNYNVLFQDANGCLSSIIPITITAIPKVALTLTSNNPSCNGSFDGGITIDVSGGSPSYTYDVTSTNTTISGQALPTTPYTISDGGGGGYTYSVSVYDVNECFDTATVTLVDPGAITFTASELAPDTCSQGVGLIQVTGASGGVSPYTYSVNSGTASSNSILPGVSGSNFVEIFDANLCSDTQTVVVSDITGVLNAGTGGVYESCPGESNQVSAYGGQNYIWMTSAGDTLLYGPSVLDVIADSNEVIYVEITSGTCTKLDSVIIHLLAAGCDLGEISNNVFTPDGDGVNEVFIIDLPLLLKNKNTVTIYNRWGDVINKIENYNNIDNVWDGKNEQGENVPAGTYFYVIEIPEADYTNSGWIQVIR